MMIPSRKPLLSRTPPKADHRIAYGVGESRFGELWLPPGRVGRWPVVVFFHGGWWSRAFGLEYCSHLCAALRGEGVAVWSVEYRRVGAAGGGWPGTFEDAAAGFDHVSELAKSYPLDLGRVMAAGHSAGGQLAFWLAGRHHVPPQSPLASPQPVVRLRGVVALAGVVNLRLAIGLSGYRRGAVLRLMGGTPEEHPDRYRAGNPGDLLPLSVRQVLIQGMEDAQVPPELARRWAEMARRQGDEVAVRMVAGADHFDVVDPLCRAWTEVLGAVRGMLD